MSIAINKKVKFDGARCPFSTFLRFQGDHYCACAQKWCHFSYFSKSFQTNKKKIKALRPKMTKIAPRGSCLKVGISTEKNGLLREVLHEREEKEKALEGRENLSDCSVTVTTEPQQVLA